MVTVQQESLAGKKLGELSAICQIKTIQTSITLWLNLLICQTFPPQTLKKNKLTKVSPCQTFPLYGICFKPSMHFTPSNLVVGCLNENRDHQNCHSTLCHYQTYCFVSSTATQQSTKWVPADTPHSVFMTQKQGKKYIINNLVIQHPS